MIYSIINNLLPYFTTLNFADRVAGIAYGVELPIMTEDNQTVLKRFPVIENLNKNQCDGNDYVSLVPDDSLKSLIYHELISDRIDEDNDSYQQHTATVRLVAWFNLRNINEHLTNCEQLLQLINNKIPFQIADFSTAYRITCETTDKRIRDKSIFSQWTYSESEKQYLIYPFDFGHLTLQISYRLNKCAEDIVLDPNACNDLKAKPFATVYDKQNVIELYAGENHTCEACSTAPVLVKDSAGTLLYTKNPGETATITDSKIYDSVGTEIFSVKAQAPQTIPDVIVKNSENTTIATIKAKSVPTTIADITVTNPITGAIYPYPAKKDLTESTYKKIKLGFKATYDDSQEYAITSEEAGTFANQILVNCTVVYEINNVVSTLPLTFANGNTYKATITRTNAALDSSVTITT
jgi:hypothetical protein